MDWQTRVRHTFHGATVPDAEVIEELAQHAKSAYEAARAEGFSEAEADRSVEELLARWRLNATALTHRRPKTVLAIPPPAAVSSSPLAGLRQDLRYALRVMARQRRYALLVILTTALGIGAATLLITVSYGVLVRPLPWPKAERVVVLEERRGGRPPRFGTFSNTAYAAWTGHAETIEEIAAWSQRTATLTDAGDPERIQITAASPGLFTVLGIAPIAGSLFTPADERANVVVLAERLWRRRFGSDPAVVGRLVRLDGQSTRIVGVVADAAGYPDRRTDAWVPYRIAPPTGNLLSMFNAIATLRPGITPAQAAVEGTARGRFVADTGMTTTAIFGGDGLLEITAVPLGERLTADVRRPLLVLLTAVALLLSAATANIAGLQLARATARRRELAIRVAIGAARWRLTRQLLVENLVLGLAGGVTGILLAWWLQRSLPTLLPADFPRIDDLRFDATIVGIALLLSIAIGLAIGWLPARRASLDDVTASIADDGTAPVGVGRRSRTARSRAAIMCVQVAITAVLLVGGSLLWRTFHNLVSVDRGYDPSHVYTTRVTLPASMYTPERRHELAATILARLTTLPGVNAAGFASELPLTPGGSTAAFTLQSPDDGHTVAVQASPRLISAGAFAALGVRVRDGRGFSESDIETSEPVAIVNRTFARRFLSDRAVGATVPMGLGYENPSRVARIVGVIDDLGYVAAGEAAQPELYYTYRQLAHRLPVPGVSLLVRTSADAAAVASGVRAILRDTDKDLVMAPIATMDERIVSMLSRPRLYAIVLGSFAACALVVSAVGLFAVLSYGVAERSRELAVRSALGARSADLMRLVVGQGLLITAAGAAIGVLSSAALTPALGTLLYGVASHDPLTYALVPLLLIGVGVLACLAPAWRAARTDTMRVLRQ